MYKKLNTEKNGTYNVNNSTLSLSVERGGGGGEGWSFNRSYKSVAPAVGYVVVRKLM